MSSALKAIVVTILSRNRGEFLAATLESWLRQTTPAAKIVVLDNASDTSTVAVIEGFASRGVMLDRAPELISVAENFKRARRHAGDGWVIVAHDDDIYHPEYLEAATRALTAAQSAPGLVLGTMSFDFNPTLEFIHSLRGVKPAVLTVAKLAERLYDGCPVNFGATLYRHDVFRGLEPDWQRYANLFDRPFLLACAHESGAILLDGPVVKYRVHRGQDVRNAAGALPVMYAYNLVACYRDLLRIGTVVRPDAFARRSLYLLWDLARRETRDAFRAFGTVAEMGILSAVDWAWGTIYFPWYFTRYRLAAWSHRMRERISR